MRNCNEIFNFQIQIKVSAHMPYIDVNPALKEKIRQVMSSHYDVKTQHLDLFRFYAKEGMFQIKFLELLSISKGVFECHRIPS